MLYGWDRLNGQDYQNRNNWTPGKVANKAISHDSVRRVDAEKCHSVAQKDEHGTDSAVAYYGHAKNPLRRKQASRSFAQCDQIRESANAGRGRCQQKIRHSLAALGGQTALAGLPNVEVGENNDASEESCEGPEQNAGPEIAEEWVKLDIVNQEGREERQQSAHDRKYADGIVD